MIWYCYTTAQTNIRQQMQQFPLGLREDRTGVAAEAFIPGALTPIKPFQREMKTGPTVSLEHEPAPSCWPLAISPLLLQAQKGTWWTEDIKNNSRK